MLKHIQNTHTQRNKSHDKFYVWSLNRFTVGEEIKEKKNSTHWIKIAWYFQFTTQHDALNSSAKIVRKYATITLFTVALHAHSFHKQCRVFYLTFICSLLLSLSVDCNSFRGKRFTFQTNEMLFYSFFSLSFSLFCSSFSFSWFASACWICDNFFFGSHSVPYKQIGLTVCVCVYIFVCVLSTVLSKTQIFLLFYVLIYSIAECIRYDDSFYCSHLKWNSQNMNIIITTTTTTTLFFPSFV